jgi:hypothetical protein
MNEGVLLELCSDVFSEAHRGSFDVRQRSVRWEHLSYGGRLVLFRDCDRKRHRVQGRYV